MRRSTWRADRLSSRANSISAALTYNSSAWFASSRQSFACVRYSGAVSMRGRRFLPPPLKRQATRMDSVPGHWPDFAQTVASEYGEAHAPELVRAEPAASLETQSRWQVKAKASPQLSPRCARPLWARTLHVTFEERFRTQVLPRARPAPQGTRPRALPRLETTARGLNRTHDDSDRARCEPVSNAKNTPRKDSSFSNGLLGRFIVRGARIPPSGNFELFRFLPDLVLVSAEKTRDFGK